MTTVLGRLSSKFQLNHFLLQYANHLLFCAYRDIAYIQQYSFMYVPENQTGVATLEIILDDIWNIVPLYLGNAASSQALHHQVDGKYYQSHVKTGWNWFSMVMAWCSVMWNSQTWRRKGVLQGLVMVQLPCLVSASYAWSGVTWAYEDAGPVSRVRLQAWDQRVPCYWAPWVSLGLVQVRESFQKKADLF